MSSHTGFSFYSVPVVQPMAVLATPAVDAAPPTPSPRAALSFSALPGHEFFISLSTDKLEMAVSVESKRSKDQWECRVDDEALKKCGPEGVEIPRSVVAALLSETLDAMKQQTEDDDKASTTEAGGHSVDMKPGRLGDDLVLILALDFGAGWNPVYRLCLEQKEVKTEDRLRAQIVDLQDEMAQMRAKMLAMEAKLQQQASTCQARHRY